MFVHLGLVSLLTLVTSCTLPKPTGRARPEQREEHQRAAPSAADARRRAGHVSERAVPSAVSTFERARLWSVDNDWEPTVAAAPDAPVIYQLTTRYGSSEVGPDGPDPALIFRRSLNAGLSWEPDRWLDRSPGTQNDPQLATAAGGLVFAAWLHDWDVVVTRSEDHGVSWSAPVSVLRAGHPPSWSDKPALVVAPDGRDVYVAFNAADSWVAVSHDSGASFGPPVKTSADDRYWFHTGGDMGPDGSVAFVATDYAQDYTGEARVHVVRSVDGGASWTTSLVASSAELPDCSWSPGCPFGFLGPTADLVIEATGRLVVAFHAGALAGAPQQLFVTSSWDGVLWDPALVVGAPLAGVQHAFPRLAAGRAPGDLRLTWQDDRAGVGLWNTWLRRTSDGGAHWTQAERLSDVSRGPDGSSRAGYAFPYGDYMGIAVGIGGTTYAIWGEGRSYSGPGGTWFTRGP